jgi:hypothetical protein
MKTKNRFKRWIVCSIALVSFAAGFMVVGVTHADETRLDTNHVFELLIYHTRPGKAPVLESVFRDALKVMAKHGISVVGFWVAKRRSRLERHVYLHRGPSQSGRSEKELGRASYGSTLSAVHRSRETPFRQGWQHVSSG